MTNLIYVDRENSSGNQLLFKIKFLLFEYTFYFDSSDELRRLGYDIGARLFENDYCGFYQKVLKSKKHCTLIFRLLLSLPLILIGIHYLQICDDFFTAIVCLGMIASGIAAFVFIFNRCELKRIDHSFLQFLKHIAPTNDESNDDQKSGIKMINLMSEPVNGAEVKDNNVKFLGFPIELLLKLLSPLQDGSLGDNIMMSSSDYQQFIDNLVFGTSDNAFFIPRNQGEFFRTFFYNVYDRLKELYFKSDDLRWTKTAFFEKLSGAVKNYRNLNEQSLRVHQGKVAFSHKVKEHLTSLSESFDKSRYS